MKYEIKVRTPQFQRLFFEVWFSGVRVRMYKSRSSAEAYIAKNTVAVVKCTCDWGHVDSPDCTYVDQFKGADVFGFSLPTISD